MLSTTKWPLGPVWQSGWFLAIFCFSLGASHQLDAVHYKCIFIRVCLCIAVLKVISTWFLSNIWFSKYINRYRFMTLRFRVSQCLIYSAVNFVWMSQRIVNVSVIPRSFLMQLIGWDFFCTRVSNNLVLLRIIGYGMGVIKICKLSCEIQSYR